MGKFNTTILCSVVVLFNYRNMRRVNKFSKEEEIDLIFDLINAIVVANKSDKAVIILQELFTPHEIRTLSKRLRIAKLLLEGLTYEEIMREMKCSFATIAKINAWLNQSGQLKKIIKQLPERQQNVNFVGYKFRTYKLIEALWEDYLNAKADLQRLKVEKLLENVNVKKKIFDKIQEEVDKFYKRKVKK
jgi:TrpR-related protein YerC/YecD